jgi:hypothetical protein
MKKYQYQYSKSKISKSKEGRWGERARARERERDTSGTKIELVRPDKAKGTRLLPPLLGEPISEEGDTASPLLDTVVAVWR